MSFSWCRPDTLWFLAQPHFHLSTKPTSFVLQYSYMQQRPDSAFPSLMMATLESLPNEILTQIFKELQQLGQLQPIQRLISRRFDGIISALVYQHSNKVILLINTWLKACFTDPQWIIKLRLPSSRARLQVHKNIRLHTRHITITRALHIPLFVEMLYFVRKLEMLT